MVNRRETDALYHFVSRRGGNCWLMDNGEWAMDEGGRRVGNGFWSLMYALL